MFFNVFLLFFLMFLFEKIIKNLKETSLAPTKSRQNLSPGRFRHAESESEVENREVLHPDLKVNENRPEKI